MNYIKSLLKTHCIEIEATQVQSSLNLKKKNKQTLTFQEESNSHPTQSIMSNEIHPPLSLQNPKNVFRTPEESLTTEE